jgi:hypothetical protein
MTGNIPDWIDDESKVANVNRWVYDFDEQCPEWIVKGVYPSWIENVTIKTKVMMT